MMRTATGGVIKAQSACGFSCDFAWVLLVAASLQFVGSASGTAAESAAADDKDRGASYASAPCPNPIIAGLPEYDLGLEFDCGYLTIPEDRGKSDGRSIRIPVAKLKATSPNPKPDPILFLAGGPGGSGLLEQSSAKGWNAERDVIFISQRGTIKAEPFLSCPEIDDFRRRAARLVSTDPATAEAAAAATRACRDRLAGGEWDLSAYNTTENAADVADLRVALGIAEWNVYAVSYGTDLALQLLRDHPEGIRTMVLDGLVPPQQRSVEKDWSAAAEGYRALFDACSADMACRAVYPNTWAEFQKLVNDLTTQPRTISVTDPATGQKADVVIDGYKLADLVGPGSNDAELRAKIPSLLHNLATGDGTEAALALLPKKLPTGLFGYGLQWGVQCSEYVPFTSPEKVLADAKRALPSFPNAVLSLLPQTPYVFSDCEQWDVRPADKRVTLPAHSDIPILLISGAIDPITPPSWAEIAASTLPNSRQVVFPGAGHGVFHWSPECFVTIMQSFLNRADPLDDECLRHIEATQFAPGAGEIAEPGPARAAVGPAHVPNGPATLAARDEAALERALDKGFAESNMPGVAVGLWIPGAGTWMAARGLSDRGTRRPMTVDLQAPIGSITKSFTVTLALQLVGEGGLNLNDSIEQWYPSIPKASAISVKMLMNHSSGIADIGKQQVDLHCADPNRLVSPDELIDIAVALPRASFPPGKGYLYSSANSIILGRILEKATGQSFSTLISKRLLEPLALNRTKLDADGKLDPPFSHGYTDFCPDMPRLTDTSAWPQFSYAAGALASTLADLHRWGVALGEGYGLTPALSLMRIDDELGVAVQRDPKSDRVISFGHAGSEPGYSANVQYYPCTGAVWALMGNGDGGTGEVFTAVLKALQPVVEPLVASAAGCLAPGVDRVSDAP